MATPQDQVSRPVLIVADDRGTELEIIGGGGTGSNSGFILYQIKDGTQAPPDQTSDQIKTYLTEGLASGKVELVYQYGESPYIMPVDPKGYYSLILYTLLEDEEPWEIAYPVDITKSSVVMRGPDTAAREPLIFPDDVYDEIEEDNTIFYSSTTKKTDTSGDIVYTDELSPGEETQGKGPIHVTPDSGKFTGGLEINVHIKDPQMIVKVYFANTDDVDEYHQADFRVEDDHNITVTTPAVQEPGVYDLIFMYTQGAWRIRTEAFEFTAIPKPGTPTNLRHTFTGGFYNSQYHFAWDHPDTVTFQHYVMEYKQGAAAFGGAGSFNTDYPDNTGSLDAQYLTPEVPIDVRVRALDVSDPDNPVYSDPSNVVTVPGYVVP